MCSYSKSGIRTHVFIHWRFTKSCGTYFVFLISIVDLERDLIPLVELEHKISYIDVLQRAAILIPLIDFERVLIPLVELDHIISYIDVLQRAAELISFSLFQLSI